MKSIIVGTAGHIDHGKTALVKALTGIDADRLAEEKRRGITIDLGFAHLDLPVPNGETLRLGFVDVPGHERFVRNMLAGVGGIDLVLLVIAADESVKPQTREHFDILQLLGVQRGITVLTKSDAVDADTLEVVRLEVEDFLRGTFLETPNSPIVAVSSLTGAGVPELRQKIVKAAAQVKARDSHALPRLPIDRVFTMKGFGTVVTGTLLAGTIHVEDELEVFPESRVVRVRGIQVHSDSVASAVAGQRTALNLAGASTEDLARGMTLAAPNTFLATRRADVQLALLPSAPRAVKNRARVHFHSNTMETVAELILHGEKQVAPGASVFARIKLPAPALLLPGDRFIIRQFSPLVTIGGGVLLDPAPVKRAPELANFLTLLATRPFDEVVLARVARQRASGISMAALIAETGKKQNEIEQALSESIRSGRIARVGAIFMDAAALQSLKTDLVSAVRQFHTRNPLVPGVNREQLREQKKISSPTVSVLVDDLVKNRQIEIVEDLIRLPGHDIVMKDDEAESRKKIEDAFAIAGLKVPALYEVIAGLKIDKARAQKIVTLLLREKILVKITDDLVFHQKALVLLRQQIAACKTKSPKIDVAQFKELTSVSRKYAIPLLEYLDRERVTKRVGDAREIL